MKILIALSQFTGLYPEQLRGPGGQYNHFLLTEKLWKTRPPEALVQFCYDQVAAGNQVSIVSDWPITEGQALERWFLGFNMPVAPRGPFNLIQQNNNWQDLYTWKHSFYLSQIDTKAGKNSTIILEDDPCYTKTLAIFAPTLGLFPNVYLAKNVLGTPQKAQATA